MSSNWNANNLAGSRSMPSSLDLPRPASRVRCEVDTPDCLLILTHIHTDCGVKGEQTDEEIPLNTYGRRRHRRGEPICGRSDNTFALGCNQIEACFDDDDQETIPGTCSEPTATDLDLRCRSNNVVVGHLEVCRCNLSYICISSFGTGVAVVV